MSILACQPYVNPRITLVLGLNDRTPTTVVRVSPLRKAKEVPKRKTLIKNTAHRTPAALASRASRNDAPGPPALGRATVVVEGPLLARGAGLPTHS